MFTAHISFPKGDQPGEAIAELAGDLLACWYKNGQVIGTGWPMFETEDSIEAIVTIPDGPALELGSDNKYATECREAFDAAGCPQPTAKISGQDPLLSSACSCGNRSGQILFTHYMDSLSPIKCLDCFLPVPLYRLPHIQDSEHLGILHWAANYKACDTLNMHCSVGERFGEQQLFKVDSRLAIQGREKCKSLEALTKTPTYYYVHKTRHKSRTVEEARACPACGGTWFLANSIHIFDFKCDGCRLLSAIPSGVS